MDNLKEYQALAMRTSPDGHDRMMNGIMGLIGESGEVVDAVKKWKFQSGDHAEIPKEKLIDELGDVLWYCAEISTHCKFNMMDAKRRLGFDGLKYQGILHLEAIFLSKLANDMADRFLNPEDNFTNPQYIVCCVIDLVEYILTHYCDSTLKECMEHNIAKLMKRYPDGFDPERSLHREE